MGCYFPSVIARNLPRPYRGASPSPPMTLGPGLGNISNSALQTPEQPTTPLTLFSSGQPSVGVASAPCSYKLKSFQRLQDRAIPIISFVPGVHRLLCPSVLALAPPRSPVQRADSAILEQSQGLIATLQTLRQTLCSTLSSSYH